MIVITPTARLFLTGFWLFSRVHQRQLEVSLLWHPGEARLATQPAAGGHPVHGHEAAACPSKTEVSPFS